MEEKNQVIQTQGTQKRGEKLSALTKTLILLITIILIGVGLLVWKEKVLKPKYELPKKFTEEDFMVLLKGEDPTFLKRLKDNPSARQKILTDIKQMFAFAHQAKKEGLADDEEAKEMLEEIRIQITAISYDREKNKDKGPMPPFGFIEEDQVNEFYKSKVNQALFDTFIKRQIERAKERGFIAKDAEPSEEEIERARSDFAKTRIYEQEFRQRASELDEDFKRKVDLRVKIQQASYLASRYSREVLAKKLEISDSEIEKYLKEHPELDIRAEKKAKAEELLTRVLAGEDFGELARQFSEDPGSKDKGGLYENIAKGSFIPEFEEVALSLQPGQIAPRVVESKYGYHIIKLEKLDYKPNRDGTETQTYNVRHILLSTNVPDPDNPGIGPIPLKELVKEKLVAKKQQEILDEIMQNNPITVPDDFPVPELSPEQLQQLEEQERIRQEELKKLREESGKSEKKTDNKKKK
ncbi:MAG: peptidylprolyl isomerase [Pyrinomonadaceae bacterium]|nr:peptidylprolyl isomerase [Pyrinomonadaceae bacterium]MCX7640886.1 peptidylprolyl isomerase [Pyrinomonadaceae bacterium]MDW8304277.1 peptidylprolyl isomerase [Acidobacteriota bacterium]